MATGLNAGGWLFLIGAWGAIIVLTLFCFKRVLFGQGKGEEGTGPR